MKTLLFIFIIISSSNIIAQDEIKIKLAELWWNNEIEMINSRNQTVSYDDAIKLIRNQKVSTNCWSNFYRYTQNIQQSSGEQVSYFSLSDTKIIQKDSNNFEVVSALDKDTGEPETNTLFSYNLINPRINEIIIEEEVDKFLNERLIISRIIFKDSLNQFVDDCHYKYSIELLKDGSFKQGYEDKPTCTCEISSEEFEQIHHLGFSKFEEANHNLLGMNGIWKIENQKLYLKFQSGNIYKYDYKIEGDILKLRNRWTTIELKTPTDNK